MWNENHEVPEKTKRNCAKKDMLKVKHALFIVKLADNVALMTLEQMKENVIEKYSNISILKTQFYYLS